MSTNQQPLSVDLDIPLGSKSTSKSNLQLFFEDDQHTSLIQSHTTYPVKLACIMVGNKTSYLSIQSHTHYLYH